MLDALRTLCMRSAISVEVYIYNWLWWQTHNSALFELHLAAILASHHSEMEMSSILCDDGLLMVQHLI